MTIPEAIEVLRNFKLDMSQPDAFRMLHAIGMAEEALHKTSDASRTSILPEIKNPEVLKDAIDRYGAPAQIDMAIEEMSELTKALLKNRRNYAAITADERGRLHEAIIEEAADVIVTVAQVIMIYAEPEEIQNAVDFKIERLRKRLEEG